MLFAINRNTRQDGPGTFLSIQMICLLTVFIMAAVGCASAPIYRAHPELPQRAGTIKTVGLLPPMVSMYEEQYKFGLNKMVPRDDWFREATEAVKKAFIDEMAAIRMPAKVIKGEDPDLNDMLDIYSAVDVSIARHVYGDWKEMFPEKARSFDYSLGPARELMERHQVDAVWIVTGFNLLPTMGAQWGDATGTFLEIMSALGGHGLPSVKLKKFEFRAALVDKSGEIVFYAKLDESDVPQERQNAGQFDAAQGERTTGQAAAEEPVKEDMRDPRFAGRYVRALLSEYRKAVAQ